MRPVPREEYDSRFKNWLVTQGPNTGSGFFGKWAWHGQKESEFRKLFGIRPVYPASSARPSTFAEFWRQNR